MARMVKDVFLASPFEEFQLLRKMLNTEINRISSRSSISLIDLNDGAITHRPPLEECISRAKKSDFMILLMGDTYGSCAPNMNKSYTHLEYDSAMDKESQTVILVFCIGNSYKNNNIQYSNNESFKQFQKQIESNHTIGYFSKEKSLELVVPKIIQELMLAVNNTIQSEDQDKISSQKALWQKSKEQIELEDYVEEQKLGHLEYKIVQIENNHYRCILILNGAKIFSVGAKTQSKAKYDAFTQGYNRLIKFETLSQLKNKIEKFVAEKQFGKIDYIATRNKKNKYTYIVLLNGQTIAKVIANSKFKAENAAYTQANEKLQILDELPRQKEKVEKLVIEKQLGRLEYITTLEIDNLYNCTLFLNGNEVLKVSGITKNEAENTASKQAYKILQNSTTKYKFLNKILCAIGMSPRKGSVIIRN